MEWEHLTYKPIDLSAMLAICHDPKAGGIVLFSGEVRDHHKGKDVSQISYEAHEPMAEQMLHALLSETKQRFGLSYAQVIHRLGDVGICESAVAIITTHAHRKNAYEANMYIIDRLKAEIPIWKKEIYIDGTHYWGVQ